MAEKVVRLVDTTVAGAESMKVHTADVLEEAARKLREADVSARGEDIKAILSDVQARMDELGGEVGKKVEPVETFITEHPFTSVLIAVSLGFLVGSLVSRVRD